MPFNQLKVHSFQSSGFRCFNLHPYIVWPAALPVQIGIIIASLSQVGSRQCKLHPGWLERSWLQRFINSNLERETCIALSFNLNLVVSELLAHRPLPLSQALQCLIVAPRMLAAIAADGEDGGAMLPGYHTTSLCIDVVVIITTDFRLCWLVGTVKINNYIE